MDKNLTAVEWLIAKLQTQDGTYRGFCNIAITHEKLINQAKEIEKERKYKFADEYCEAVMSGCNLRPEQYDNETYGGVNK
jgi:hypothetical protein